MTKCAVVDCESASRSNGFCDKHYYRFKTHGDPLVTVRGCGYCRKYDDPANLRFYGRGERKTPIHKECNSIGHRIYMANRRATANPSLQETLL